MGKFTVWKIKINEKYRFSLYEFDYFSILFPSFIVSAKNMLHLL